MLLSLLAVVEAHINTNLHDTVYMYVYVVLEEICKGKY